MKFWQISKIFLYFALSLRMINVLHILIDKGAYLLFNESLQIEYLQFLHKINKEINVTHIWKTNITFWFSVDLTIYDFVLRSKISWELVQTESQRDFQKIWILKLTEPKMFRTIEISKTVFRLYFSYTLHCRLG